MNYNVIDIFEHSKTDLELKKIINKKIYRIIEIMEESDNYSK